MNHHPISQANKREQQTQQQWIQQVAGNPRWERITNKTPQDRERRLEIQGEQRHGEGKRCQLNTEDVKRQQQNTTITLQTKPTKRGNTDCRCFSKMRSIEFATNRRGIIERQVYSQNYPFLDTTIGLGSKNNTICKIDMRTIFLRKTWSVIKQIIS